MQQEPTGEVVLFFTKDDMFYPIQLSGTKPTADEVPEHVELNSHVTSVEDIHGNVLWPTKGIKTNDCALD